MHCNICGSEAFGKQGTREKVRCLKCGSLERTRALKLYLDNGLMPKRGDKILHVSPERVFAEILKAASGDGYLAVDLYPELFPGIEVKKFDLCKEAESLSPNTYDYIIHSHVLEHLPCNWTMVLLFLHRALKQNGQHIFCMPILGGEYEESLKPLSADEAVRRFGQNDHVRKIGRSDLDKTLGMIFKGDLRRHILGNRFSDNELDAVNVPESERRTLNSSTVFVFGKNDLRLDS